MLVEEIELLQTDLLEKIIHVVTYRSIDLIIDEGPNARPVRLNIPPFALICTTTRDPITLSASIRKLITYEVALAEYTASEIALMLVRFCARNDLSLDMPAGIFIAEDAHNQLHGATKKLKWVIAFALGAKTSAIDEILVREALSFY